MMKLLHAVCVLSAITTPCLASSLGPFPTALIDQLILATKSADSGVLALGLLEYVAEGRANEIDPVAAGKFGLKLSQIRDPYLKDPSARAYAIRRMGEVDLPEALNYLSRLKREDFVPDESGQLWPSVLLGLNTARLNRTQGSQAKVEFLEKALQRGGVTAWWAANELCDRGSQKSLPFIRDSIKKRDSSQRGEDEFRFCETRVQVLARNLDRASALVSVLDVNDADSGSRDLQLWAVKQLVSLHLPEADRALDRYRTEIGKLPDRSPEKQRLYIVGEEIRTLMGQRSIGGQ